MLQSTANSHRRTQSRSCRRAALALSAAFLSGCTISAASSTQRVEAELTRHIPIGSTPEQVARGANRAGLCPQKELLLTAESADGSHEPWSAAMRLRSRAYVIPLASNEGNVVFYFDENKRLTRWKQNRWMTGP